MCRAVYWIGIALAAGGTGISIWLLDPSEVLFPGLLTLFSFCLVWTTLAFQEWTKVTAMKRENPELLVYLGAPGLVSSGHKRSFILCVSNPGVLAGSLTRISILTNVESNSKVTWNWESLHPLLSPRMDTQPIGSLPVPLLPGSLIALYPTAAGDYPKDGRLSFSFTFKMGDYKERTIERVIATELG